MTNSPGPVSTAPLKSRTNPSAIPREKSGIAPVSPLRCPVSSSASHRFACSSPVAAAFSTGSAGYFEIYGVKFTSETRQSHIISELLIALLNEYAQMDAKYLTYLCDEAEKDVLSELGFRCVGQYVLYTKVFS